MPNVQSSVRAKYAKHISHEIHVSCTLVMFGAAGSIAGFRAQLAKSLLDAGINHPLMVAVGSKDDMISSTAAWVMEQVGRHGLGLVDVIVNDGALQQLLHAYVR